MDFEKLKKDLEEKGVEKSQEELDKLKGRLGGFNSGQVSTTQPEQGNEIHVGPPTDHYSGQMANSGHTGTTPVMDSGKADIGEPDSPGDEEKIREPRPEEEQVQHVANDQQAESRREAAIEQNPASDEDQAEDAA